MALTHITTCLLCDPAKPKKLSADSLPKLDPAIDPPEQVKKYFQDLVTHLQQTHPEALSEVIKRSPALLQIFQVLLVSRNFTSTDPMLEGNIEGFRDFILDITAKPEPSRIVTA